MNARDRPDLLDCSQRNFLVLDCDLRKSSPVLREVKMRNPTNPVKAKTPKSKAERDRKRAPGGYSGFRNSSVDDAEQGGWLVFATHDVCDKPTRFGCTPAVLEDILQAVVDSGAKVLPVHSALEMISGRDGN